MTPRDFRELALSLPEASESAHMGHPDFRVRKKIFATLWADDLHGMVKLTPQQQKTFVKSWPDIFSPVKGGWGLQGSTSVDLEDADPAIVRRALICAWRNVAPKTLANAFEEDE